MRHQVARAFAALFMETSYVARVYGDSLRDNFVGYVPVNQTAFAQLKSEFEAEIAQPHPNFAELLRIEAALVETMPDPVVQARFWAVDDRFRRVVPTSTCDRYDKSVPGRGDACWQMPAFLRDQTRTLLDVIHANYLINIGREKSVKRLKTIMSLSVLAIIGLGFLISWLADGTPISTGLLLLAGAGIFGSTLSIINRLQAATQVDAMTQDGIYELTGLRVGWVGVLMSFVLGGGFALVLYFIVMGGVLEAASPKIVDSPAKPPAGANPDPTKLAEEKTAEVLPPTANLVSASDAMRKSAAEAMASGTAIGPTPQPSHPPVLPVPKPDLNAGNLTKLMVCPTDTKEKPCLSWAQETGGALGFADTPSFFKMLILAFLAGFAERFVPDILNRLSKQPSRS
jgi:hypothetical protein